MSMSMFMFMLANECSCREMNTYLTVPSAPSGTSREK